MNSQVHVATKSDYEPERTNVRSAALEGLRLSGQEDVELTIVLVDDETVKQLNRQYRDQDKVTDVLSFPLGEADPDSGLHYLGDVVISVPQARRQADAAGHPLASELALLAVHGVLHLLGHDHADADAKSQMWSLQQRALQELGIEIADPGQR